MPKPDIANRQGIEKLVRSFYQELLKDPKFNHIFLEVVEIDVLNHIDIIVDFWESVLFHSGAYKNNTMKVHMDLHFKHALSPDLFSAWLSQFDKSVDGLFSGPKASEAKSKAKSIAALMKMKINNLDQMQLKIND